MEEEGCAEVVLAGLKSESGDVIRRVLEVGPKGIGYRVSHAGGEENCHYWNGVLGGKMGRRGDSIYV